MKLLPLNNSGGDTASREERWQAPTTPDTYTLKCVINDTPTAIAADETGTRDDPNPLEQIVTMQIVPDEPPSIAKLKFYPDVNGAPGTVEK